MLKTHCKNDANWLEVTLEALKREGYIIVEGVLDDDLLAQTSEALYKVQQKIHQEVGLERLQRAGEVGIMRLLPKYEPIFLELLKIPEVLAIVDNTVSNTAIMHVQNGFILPPLAEGEARDIFQTRFHMDFNRVLNGFMCSVNTLFMIDEFTAENGGTLIVPCTHQMMERPSNDYLKENAISAEGPAGSMIVFDSTLWHAAGPNLSNKDRKGINLQFTRSYFKQQMDYVRALGDEVILSQPDRVQQILGYYTRVPTSLDEFYRPADQRLYRGGQG